MKTFISLFLCLLLYNTIEAQIFDLNTANKTPVATTNLRTIATTDSERSVKREMLVKTTGTNAKYLNLSRSIEHPKYVKQLQALAAAYDIKTSNDYNRHYDDVRYAVYHVIIKTNNGRITAQYNGKGEIKKTSERYTNVAIPTDIVIKIMHDFPDWKITNQTCLITYLLNKGSVRTFEVTLIKDQEQKTLDLDTKGNII